MTRAVAISAAQVGSQHASRGAGLSTSRLVVFPPRYSAIIDVADLSDDSENTANQSVDLAFIWDIGHGFSLRKPFSVYVEQTDDVEYVARFPEANINASGSSFDEAIKNWKDVLAFKFDHYSSFPTDQLGSGPKADLAALGRYIKRT